MGGVILSPFSTNLAYYLTLIILTFAPFAGNLIFGRIINNFISILASPLYLLHTLSDCIVESYILVLIYSIFTRFSHFAASIFKWITISLVSVMAIINIGCMLSMCSLFTKEHVALIRATNSNEASGFFSTYFTPGIWIEIILIIALTILTIIIIQKLLKSPKVRKYARKITVTMIVIALLSLAYLVYLMINPTEMFYQSDNSVFSQFRQWREIIRENFATIPDLENPHPALDTSHAILPDNLLVIIGESADRDNMSVYGYNIPDTPYFNKLNADSTAYFFTQTTSPSCLTMYSFSHFMTTDNGTERKESDIPYYKCETLPEIIKEIGYTTTWFSNQFRTQLVRDPTPGFINLCDSIAYLTEENLGDYDENTIHRLEDYFTKNDSAQCIFIHLMGSHEDFDARVPSNFHPISIDFYQGGMNDRQKKTLCSYDNSIAYTDSVIQQLISVVDSTSTLIIYFSDHGLDLFESNKKMCGHGRTNDDVSYEASIKVPFMIYPTDKYKTMNPGLVQKLSRSIDKPFNLTDLIPVLMDIIGVEFADKPDFVKKRSFLSAD